MRKIGILTFHFAHNYGAMLQAYALKTYLPKEGYTAEIINYESDFFEKQYRVRPIVLSKNPAWVLKNLALYWQKKPQANTFETFKRQELGVTGKRLSSGAEVNQKAAEFDAVFVGSDQLWNMNLTRNDMTYFLVNLAEKIKRIAYAVSSGNYCFTDPKVLEALRRFRAISVREVETCSRLETKGISAQVCVDPVFLLDRGKWEVLEAHAHIPKPQDCYILYYALQETKALTEKTLALSKKEKLKIRIVDGKLGNKSIQGEYMRNVGPIEFIRLLSHAEIICTNSFHALAFSIIFQKKIFVVANASTGFRMRNLLATVGIEDLGSVIDCGKLRKEKLDLRVQESMTYIKNNLS